MNFEPLEHQKLAIDWLIHRTQSALFADMGLGKSASVLKALEHLFGGAESRGALIVAPLRVAVLTWPNEVAKWGFSNGWRVADLRTKEGQEAFKNGSAEIYTINYEMLPKFCDKFLLHRRKTELPFDTVIFDELSLAKNPKSKRINAFRKHRNKFDRFWGLTGTPTPNGYEDLFAQIRLLDDGQRFGKYITRFRQAYFEPDNPFSQYPKFVLRDGMQGKIEEKIADLALTLRAQDWLKIPPTTVEDVEVKLPTDAKRVYKELEKELLIEIDNMEVVAPSMAVLTNKLLQVTSGAVYESARNLKHREVVHLHDAKIKALKKLKKAESGPLLVAIQYKHEMARILEAFPDAEPFKEDTLARWNAGKIPMLVAHPKSIGHGLNLQEGGSCVVWFSLNWSQELYDQFNARLIRTGQTSETKIYRILCPGTIDDAVAEALRSKEATQDHFLATLKNLQRLAAG